MKTQRGEQYVVDEKGRKRGVILSIARYQKMQEDLHDLVVVAERRNEMMITQHALKRRLRK